jgi:hypothetical protein
LGCLYVYLWGSNWESLWSYNKEKTLDSLKPFRAVVPQTTVYTVDGVQGLLLTVHQPNQPSTQIQLAGLTAPNERWKEEATGILSMLVQASHNQVKVSFTESRPFDSSVNALVQLPTGAYGQQILLSEGVAPILFG